MKKRWGAVGAESSALIPPSMGSRWQADFELAASQMADKDLGGNYRWDAKSLVRKYRRYLGQSPSLS